MFGNLGMGELTIMLIIVLVLFGAKRVPEISASFGKGIREFKRNLNDVEESVAGSLRDERPEWRQAPLASRPREMVAEEPAREPKRLM